MARTFPEKFHDLEPWSSWVLATEAERHSRRAQSTMEELSAFCAALRPRMEDLIRYLGQFEWGTPLNAEDRNLYHLGLTYMEATIPLDLEWKRPLAEDS